MGFYKNFRNIPIDTSRSRCQNAQMWGQPQDDEIWIGLSSRLQRFIAARSGRPGVVVRISTEPIDERRIWPSGYQVGIAEVLIDAHRVLQNSDDPGIIDPSQPKDRAAFPVLTGWLCMAAAHVAHTTWPIDSRLEGPTAAVGRGLEQARACGRYLADHPADRRWLRAAARSLFSLEGQQDFLGLVALYRVGILRSDEVKPLLDAYTSSLAGEGFCSLIDQIDFALELADDQVEDLVAAARGITDLLGLLDFAGEAEISREMGATLESIAERIAPTQDRAPQAHFGTAREVQTDFRIQDHTAAMGAFLRDPHRRAVLVREPSTEVRTQARALLATLRGARHRYPTIDLVASPLPPGRLKLAEAMRLEAQRESHARMTARPWRQLRRRDVEQPRLRVGISWDISRSQSPLHREIADMVWAVAWTIARLDGEVAAVAWNSGPSPVVWPGRIPTHVVEPECGGGSSGCPASLRALSGALRLDRDDGGRIIIIFTDARSTHRRFVQQEVDRLRGYGVPVLWLTPSVDPRAPTGSLTHSYTNGAALSRAVSTALEGALSKDYDLRDAQ